MTEHWVYESAKVEGYVIRAPESWRYVVDPTDHDGRYGPIYREADARLIAAAPEMLEALEMMLGILTVAGIAADTEAMQHLQSVIAKAIGVLAEGDSTGVLAKGDSTGVLAKGDSKGE